MGKMKKIAAIMIAMTMLCTTEAHAAAAYMDDVTREMSLTSYWLSRQLQNVDEVLADKDQIKLINERVMADPATKMHDLKKIDENVNTANINALMFTSGVEEMKTYTAGGYFDAFGNPVTEALTNAIVLNTQSTVTRSKVSYGIAAARTEIRSYPTDAIITDEVGDLNFDYMANSTLRINEPFVIKSSSNDGLYYYGYSSSTSGWVKAADIAICKDKYEWLNAWDIPSERVLVVLDGKVYLEQSNTNPSVSGLMLTMGTCLEIAPQGSYGNLVTNRSPIQNYVVYVPVRNLDGSYKKELALVSEGEHVHEGFLPLTTRNLLNVAFEMLGDTYGWGGMLASEDCSGYIRSIYKCFGLELPRNTTWQAASSSVLHHDLTGMSAEQKKSVLNLMPAGSVIFFKGHEMMYLGQNAGKYYVISSSSSVADSKTGQKMRLRSVLISSLDTKRANGTSWIDNVYMVNVPYVMK